MSGVLIIGTTQRAELRALRERAAARPVDVRGLAERLKSPEVKRAHMDHMNDLTVDLPTAFMVTFSIEIGHPRDGTARHMSLSSIRPGRMPNQFATWMVAEELGFVGGLDACVVWVEELQRGPGAEDRAKAINVVQLLATVERLQL